MRIAVDARSVYQERTLRGVGQTVLSLYRALATAKPSWSFDMYFQTPNGTNGLAAFSNVVRRPIDRPGDRFHAWQHFWFPLEVRRSGADILHAPGALAPMFPLSPMVTTVHDLTPLEFFPSDPAVHAWGRNVARGARRARRVFVPSEYTRDEVVRVFGIPRKKLEVVRWGGSPDMTRTIDPETLVRFGIEHGQLYLMHFGMALPRKNTRRLLTSWAAISPDVRKTAKLLILGLEGDSRPTFERLASDLGVADSVCLQGYVPRADLPALLSGAAGLCYVPLSEGFGLPILDAFACDTPVLASKVTSIPEVTGDAALLVAPDDEAAITTSMERLLRDPDLRAELRSKGRDQLKAFSWELCAKQVAEAFECVA
jgi:glycosyltransferase involved in cell wall biosynthesis